MDLASVEQLVEEPARDHETGVRTVEPLSTTEDASVLGGVRRASVLEPYLQVTSEGTTMKKRNADRFSPSNPEFLSKAVAERIGTAHDFEDDMCRVTVFDEARGRGVGHQRGSGPEQLGLVRMASMLDRRRRPVGDL